MFIDGVLLGAAAACVAGTVFLFQHVQHYNRRYALASESHLKWLQAREAASRTS